jgi:probable F420-dependent oxidoreductase
VLLAQEVATLDLLSEGRLEFGIGAGWLAADFWVAGVPFLPAATRVQRLEEAVFVLKRLFGDGPVTFAGTYFSVQDMDLKVKPLQRPHPPLYLGGGGRHMLAFAAREADVIGVTSKATAAGAVDLGDRTPRAFDQKVRWIREVSGERFLHIELNTLVQQVLVTDHRRQGAEQVLADYASWPSDLVVNVPSSPEEILEAPYCLIGTVARATAGAPRAVRHLLHHRAWKICRGAGPGGGAAGRHLICAYRRRQPSELRSRMRLQPESVSAARP